MASLYDTTGEKFFTPPASKNRKIYINTILFLKKVINELFETQENDKTKIVDILTDYLNNWANIKLYNYESNDEIDTEMDNRLKARLIINKLEEYEWLDEEALGNGKKTLDFISMTMILLIEEIINNCKPQYISYIIVIKTELEQFKYNILDSLLIVDDNLKKKSKP